jgi:hypothetical protein
MKATRRWCAIDTLSTLAGVPSPARHPLVAAVQAGLGALRTKRYRRGASRQVFTGKSPLLVPPSRCSAPSRGRREEWRGGRDVGPFAGGPVRSGHKAVLHQGALRYDDTLEGHLGNERFFSDAANISVFGSKTDRVLAG